MIGKVVSVKTKNTASITVENKVVHPLYKKSYTRSKKYLAHDVVGAVPGDIVEVVKIRPMSKRKHWNVIRVIGRDITEIVSEQLQAHAAAQIAEVMPEEAVSPSADDPKEEVVVEVKTEKSKKVSKRKKED